jgi:tRNA U55 pseudouridine synthase TruB
VDSSLLRVHLTCSRGTYVRSLARDLAEHLGTVGHLERLRRTKVGEFTVENAATLDELENRAMTTAAGKRFVLSACEALEGFGVIEMKPRGHKKVRNGAMFSREDVESVKMGNDDRFLVIDENKKLVAIVELDFRTWSLSFLDVFAVPM